MAKRAKPAKLPVPAAAERLFHRFKLTNGENAAEYQALVGAVVEALAPMDIVESLFAKDVADHSWEVMRLRSIEATLLIPDAASKPVSGPPNRDDGFLSRSHPIDVVMQRPSTKEERVRLERQELSPDVGDGPGQAAAT